MGVTAIKREEIVSNGCTGICCVAFRIPLKITELRRRAKKIQDGEQIAAMLIPLTPKQAREANVAAGGDADLRGTFKWAERGQHFTCRHFDAEAGLCTIYEDRPAMCRDHPYGKPCSFDDECACKGTPRPEKRPKVEAAS